MAFPENLRLYRERGKLTQRQLAELVGMTQQTIFRYEDGSRIPNFYDGAKIARALNITCEELLSTSGKETK